MRKERLDVKGPVERECSGLRLSEREELMVLRFHVWVPEQIGG